ncbi:MAG: amidohydrolase family protein [Candidatus Latescibacteria bacterium]|nr:amidohydrolase family protein [Candidatus Latescibacterota bacterium]
MIAWCPRGLKLVAVCTLLLSAAVEAATTAISNVRIFDGEQLIESGSVVIAGGVVLGVGADISWQDGAEVIDGNGYTLLPGLIDAHVHIGHQQDLEQSVVFGVTSVLDMFMDAELMAAIKERQEGDPQHGEATLFSAGTLATAPGGHGSEYGLKIPTISAPEQAGAFVAARKAEGSDYIKTVFDDGRSYGRDFPTLNAETCAALVKAAPERGLLAVVHAGSQEEARRALAAGADGLAHIFADALGAPDFGHWVADQSAFVVPTLSVLSGMGDRERRLVLVDDPLLGPYLSVQDRANLRRRLSLVRAGAYAVGERAVGQLQKASVAILAGSDAPNPGTTHGASLHRELELLVQAGLTPIEALRAATSTPAEYFDLAGRGLIRPGSPADLLLVEGDPTTDILATRAISGVWKNGQRVDRGGYLSAIEAQKEDQQLPPAPEAVGDGLVSDFENREVAARFGAGWAVSTDSLMGGTSAAQFKWASGGALSSVGSMEITGQIAAGSSNPWAGVMFWPGAQAMDPADLSARKSVSFWARGDGKTYYLMFFTQSLGYMPSIQTFTVSDAWTQFSFPFEQFGTSGQDITGVFWGGGPQAGPFVLQLDNIRFD